MIFIFQRAALALTMFFLPVEDLSFLDFGGLPVTPAKLAGLLLLIAGVVRWLVGPRTIPRSTKHLWVLAFAFSFVVSNVVAILSGLPFLSVLPYLTTDASLLLLYFLVLIIVRSRRDLDWLCGGYVTGAVVVGISAALGFGPTDDPNTTRLGGLGGNPNGAAQDIGVALPLVLVLSSGLSPLWQRVLGLLGFGVLLATGVATLSRSFFVTLPAMWSLALLRMRRVALLRYSLFGFLLVVISVLTVPDTVWDRLGTLQGGRLTRDTSAMSRLYTSQLGVVAFIKNPVAGVGRRNFMNWANRDGGGRVEFVVHNVYLTVAAEQGLLGLVPFLAIVGIAWREFGRTWRLLGVAPARTDPEARRLRLRALSLQVAFLGVLIGGLFHPMLNFKMLWVLFGLSTVVFALGDSRVAQLTRATGGLAAASEKRATVGPSHPWGEPNPG